MNKILVSVYDSKAKAYMAPVALRTTAEAIRTFEAECKTKESPFAKHPSDFSLCKAGEWDELTGELIPSDLTILANASEFVQ